MTVRRPLTLLAAAALMLATAPASARTLQKPQGADARVSAATRKQVIDAALQELTSKYVFPEVARKMVDHVRERQRAGAYDAISSARQLAETLTTDLQSVSQDKHLRVRLQPSAKAGKPAPAEDFTRFAARVNYGFDSVERLDGNVGYLKLQGFMPAALGGEVAAAAMTFLASTDALIIDLRENGGGEPEMVALITSYLFGEEPVHLNDIYERPTDTTTQYWTRSYVPGRRFGATKPVYVLTSSYTFSAAEEFTYNLKNLGRATIVGETTGGGAHPGDMVPLAAGFAMFVPTGRAVNPITRTNWERTGVAPDVQAPATQALDIAYVKALERLAAAEKDEAHKARLEELLAQRRSAAQAGGSK
jgi:C-terminal processing protease CtpA/Prc